MYRPNDFLILVDFKDKKDTERPDFYVLNFEDWKELVLKEQAKYPSIKVDKQFRITYADGWKGLNIKTSQVDAHQEKWNKIITQYKESNIESQHSDT